MWKGGLLLSERRKGLQLLLEANITNPGVVTNCCGLWGASLQDCTVCSPWPVFAGWEHLYRPVVYVPCFYFICRSTDKCLASLLLLARSHMGKVSNKSTSGMYNRGL